MPRRFFCFAAGLALFIAAPAGATIFGNVRGIVHDPQHRPVPRARVLIHSLTSDWSQKTESNVEGEFEFSAVPVGEYMVVVTAAGFAQQAQNITVASGTAPVLHFALSLQATRQEIQVTASPGFVTPEASASQTVVGRQEVAQTPGADRTNSLAMITDYVPGAYVVHDQLHVRGGHQVSWLIDGVPVPNTNIGSNVGPPFDPKDIDAIEMKTGGYSAEYGDRTYGVFNVVTRSGFERNREGELLASYGNFHETNDQVSLGSHTERFAYYASLNGNRTDLGLMTPTSPPAGGHDLGSGLGGFASLIFNATPADQLRLVTSARGDHYQIPNAPDQQAAGLRDLDLERDAFANFSWVHSFGRGTLLNVSPFYHFNRANFVGGPGDTPFILNDDRASNYVGGQGTLAVVKGKHNAQIGLEAFAQHDDALFDLRASAGSVPPVHQRLARWGGVEAVFAQEQFRATSWLSLLGGFRLTHYNGLLSENAADPRVGASIRLPQINWVLHGAYSRYYQPPPLDTVAGPLLEFALRQGVGFLPLRGERDEEYEAGATVPLRDWVFSAATFRTHARNFFDHDVIGNSNVFLPLTLQGARIFGWEAKAHSPKFLGRAQLNLAFSHQHAEGFGAVSGGLTDFSGPLGNFFLDHDQRNTLATVLSLDLPRKAWATTSVNYGSGFLAGNGPRHLPAYATVDVSVGKPLGENWSFVLTALNVGNRRYLLDESNTFGGTHYAYPRRISVEIRYHFRY